MARYAHRPDPLKRRVTERLERFDLGEALPLLARLRGTRKASELWFVIFMHCWQEGTWRDVESVVRQVQAMSDAGEFSADERFFLIAQLTDAARTSRARESASFLEIEARLDAFEQAHGLADGDYWRTGEAPPGYRALDAEWEAIGEMERMRWLEELGEAEIAQLLLNDEPAYEARCEAGGTTLCGPADEPA